MDRRKNEPDTKANNSGYSVTTVGKVECKIWRNRTNGGEKEKKPSDGKLMAKTKAKGVAGLSIDWLA